MTNATDSSASDLVVRHFDEHQRGQVAPPKTRSRRGSASIDSNILTVQARVKLIRDQLSKLNLNKSLSDLSLQDKKKDASSSSDREIVATAILQCVDAAIATEISTESQEPVDRILELAACLSCSDEHLARAIINRAAEFSTVLSERVRSQGCKLLGFCVQYLHQKEERAPLFSNDKENDDNWQQECILAVEQALVTRLDDKSQAVRLAAIEACASFSSDSDQVMESLVWNLTHDPSVANRVAALKSVDITSDTVDHVIARIRDIKVKVRTEALEVLSSKYSVHDLTPEQCAEIVRSGLTDRCDDTLKAATKLVCTSWMKSVKFDPVALLDVIGPNIFETECEKLARAIIKVAPNDCSDILRELSAPEIRAFHDGVSEASRFSCSEDSSSSILSPGQLFFVRMVCDETSSAKIEPDIPSLCELLHKHLAYLVASINSREETNDEDDNADADDFEDTLSFVCIQLLQLAKVSGDLQEEGSRRHFISEMKKMLSSTSTPIDLLEEAIRAMACAHDSETHFLQTVSEVLSELSDSDSYENFDISSSAHLRIVSILAVVLESASSQMSSNPILVNFSSYILPTITSENAMVREGGVICIGKYALLSSEETVQEEIKPLLLNVAGNRDEKVEIRGQATLAYCDLALLFNNMVDDDKELSFKSILFDMLDHSRPAVVAVAAEVAAKLLFAGKLHDASLVAQLVVVFFHEKYSNMALLYNEEGDDVTEVGSLVRLQQLLSVFFPAYTIRSKEGQQTLMESVGPILALVHAKQAQKVKGKGSLTWPIAKMIEYICSTAEMGNKQANSEREEIKQDPESYVGSRIAKRFHGSIFFGTVKEYYPESEDDNGQLWHVLYDDEDAEDFGEEDLQKALKLYKRCQADDKMKEPNEAPSETEEENKDDGEASVNVDDAPPEKTEEEHSSEPSSDLLVAVAIAKYLSQESTNLNTAYIRSLCKVLGALYVDIDYDDESYLLALKRYMGELKLLISDAASSRALDALYEALGEADSEDDEEEMPESDDESLIEALEAIALNEASEAADKENEKLLSPGQDKGTSSRRSSSRRHLASANA